MSVSTRKGGVTSRKPKHQNTFAFQHNPKSKKTAVILKMTNEGLCKSCWDKVEWKKKYRKYKPLTQPATCRDCSQRTVAAAYHKLCQPCAQAKGTCAWCCERRDLVKKTGLETLATVTKKIEEEAAAGGMSLREKRSLLRAAEKKYKRRAEGEQSGEGAEGDGDDAMDADSDADDSNADINGDSDNEEDDCDEDDDDMMDDFADDALALDMAAAKAGDAARAAAKAAQQQNKA
jgi:Uncharacterized conserved protein (DUF2039)